MPSPSSPNPSSIRPATAEDTTFSEIVGLIVATREKSLQTVNTALIDLYWNVGEIISRKITGAEWEMVLLPSWPSTSPERSPACAALPGRTYLE